MSDLLHTANRHARSRGVFVGQIRHGRIRLVMSTYSVAVNEAHDGLSITTDNVLAESARTREPIWLPDAATWRERYRHLANTPDDTEAVAIVPVPVRGAGDGIVGFTFGEPHAFDDEERAFLTGLAEHFVSELIGPPLPADQ